MKSQIQEEDKKPKKKKTMLRRAMYIAVLVAVIQILIGVVLILWGGSMKAVRNGKYDELRAQVGNRAQFLQNRLTQDKNMLQRYRTDIQNEIYALLEEENCEGKDLLKNEKLNEKAVIAVSEDIGEMLKNSSGITGAFLVLDGYGKESVKYGYYLRNSNPENIDEKNFTVLRGTQEVLDHVGYPAEQHWRPDFRISDAKDGEFYSYVYSKYMDESTRGLIRKTGFWCPAFKMYGDDQEIITYTLPLADREGEFIGILGFEIKTEELSEDMPYEELSTGSSYYIAYRTGETREFTTIAASAASGKNLADKNGNLKYIDYPEQDSIHMLQAVNGEEYLAAYCPLDLYGRQQISGIEEWNVFGVKNKEEVFEEYNRMAAVLMIAICMFALLGIGEICLICYRWAFQLREVTVSIDHASLEEGLSIEETGTTELDDLRRAVMDLNRRSFSAAKLVEIIDMTKICVGAIEYKEGDSLVFCTASAADILEFHHVDREHSYISRKNYDVEMKVLERNLVPYADEENTYQMTSRDGSDKWVRLIQREENGRTMIAVLDVTEEIIGKQKIEYERDYDILTRLLNRNAFRAKMGQRLKDGNLGVSAVVMMDLDNLKYFNDTYGHEYGDKYIREAAGVLSTLNQYDALVARMSGDEFLMFISGYSDKDEIRSMVEEVHNRLKESYIRVPTGENIRLRASAGIAWYPDDAQHLDELIKYADFAMYETKNMMKGDIKEFDSERYQKDAILFTGREELNSLFEERDKVKYVFQPIVEVASGEIFAYEALMRPQIESLRSPEDVMRLAKAQSKLYQVERMTWMAALEAVENQRKPGDKFRIFVNSVPNHVLEGKDMEELEDKYSHIMNRVVIEIIESEQTDKSCMETKCEWARKHGSRIALDDFGTGYSNESTLLYIEPDFVKLDMSLINNIHKDEGRQKIVQGLLNYTKSHGIKVIAEGIDCYDEMETLIQLGVDYMQGWYMAKGNFEIRDIPDRIKEEIRACVKRAQDS